MSILYLSTIKMYTQNHFSIVKNKQLQILQEFDYESIKSEYNELIDLCYIFSQNENEIKKLDMSNKKDLYDIKYLPILKEKKRVLTNTKKRFKYNFEKASTNESI